MVICLLSRKVIFFTWRFLDERGGNKWRGGTPVFFVCWCRAYSATFLDLSARIGEAHKGGEKAPVKYKVYSYYFGKLFWIHPYEKVINSFLVL
jgi:hypothetical protein